MLDFDYVLWDDEPGGNVEHIAAHGLTPEEVEEILYLPNPRTGISASTGRPTVFGYTSTGKYIIVVYELDSEGGITVLEPITAYDVVPPV